MENSGIHINTKLGKSSGVSWQLNSGMWSCSWAFYKQLELS